MKSSYQYSKLNLCSSYKIKLYIEWCKKHILFSLIHRVFIAQKPILKIFRIINVTRVFYIKQNITKIVFYTY
jgi:hypothetical protein